MDILRGFMALAVAFYHLSIWNQLFDSGTALNRLVALLGNYGVEGFFIISGFCFFHIYRGTSWDQRALQSFHIKRFFRIAPLYYVAVLLNLILSQARGPDPSARMLAENFTLTFGLFHPNHALVLGGWSIGIEYVFYMAFPLLAWTTRRKSALYLGCVLLIALALPWSFGKVQAASLVGDAKFHTYVQIPNHAFLFLLGGLTAPPAGHDPQASPLAMVPRPRAPDLPGHLVAAPPASTTTSTSWRASTGPVSSGSPCWWCSSSPSSRSRKAGSNSPLTLLGDWSYSVYLMHPFASLAVAHALPASTPATWRFLGSLVLTLAISAFTHRWIERPAMALGRRWANLAKSPDNGHHG